MKKTLCAAVMGLALTASAAQAQFQIGVGVSSNFGTTSYYPATVYDGGYYSTYPSYYYSAPSYYTAPSYYSAPVYGYSSGSSVLYGTPGLSIGIGRPYYGGYGYYSGYRGYRGAYRGRW